MYGAFRLHGRTSADATDIDRRLQNMRHLKCDVGLKFGVFGVSRNKNNCDLSEAYVLQSEHEDGHV